MKMMIIPVEIADKLRQTEFPKPHALDPVPGEIDGKEVYFLQAELKENKIFNEALADFEVCEVKDIETIETKYYDPKTSEEVKPTITTVDGKTKEEYLIDGKVVDIVSLDSKVVLTASNVIGK